MIELHKEVRDAMEHLMEVGFKHGIQFTQMKFKLAPKPPLVGVFTSAFGEVHLYEDQNETD